MVEHPYRIELTHTAEKELRRLGRADRERLLGTIRGLAGNPRPKGCQKMTDREEYRVRAGDFRVIYAVDDKKRMLTIYRAGHRKDVYR